MTKNAIVVVFSLLFLQNLTCQELSMSQLDAPAEIVCYKDFKKNFENLLNCLKPLIDGSAKDSKSLVSLLKDKINFNLNMFVEEFSLLSLGVEQDLVLESADFWKQLHLDLKSLVESLVSAPDVDIALIPGVLAGIVLDILKSADEKTIAKLCTLIIYVVASKVEQPVQDFVNEALASVATLEEGLLIFGITDQSRQETFSKVFNVCVETMKNLSCGGEIKPV